MKRILYCLLLFVGLLLSSCANNSSEIDGEVKVIDVSNPEEVSLNDVFSELEVIYMDANIKSYTNGIRRMYLCDDKYLLLDEHCDLFVFDKKGHFISSSKSVRGKGHGEISISIGGTYNPYSKNIEMLTPTNLMFYDTNFKYIKTVSLPTEYPGKNNNYSSIIFDKIYDLSDHVHVLITNEDERGQEINTMFIFDSEKQEIIKKICFDEDVILNMSTQKMPFQHYDNDNLLFFPTGYSKYVYKFDKEKLELNKYISFNFDDNFYPVNKKEHDAYKVLNAQENNPNTKFVWLNTLYGSEKLYLTAETVNFNNDVYIVDLKTEKITCFPYRKNGIMQFVRPTIISNDILYSCNYAYNADTLMMAFPGKVTEINKYQSDSTMNDNLVILKYHLK